MKKKIIAVLTTLMLASVFAVVATPATEVSAYTCYGDMTYDEVVSYWSSQPLFQQVYQQEAWKSYYNYEVKTNRTAYFKASLTDYCCHPIELQQQRPYTYNYMDSVVKVSNPAIYQTIVNPNQAHSLEEMILDELNKFMPTMPYDEKCASVPILLSILKSQSVTNINEYNLWKYTHGGKSVVQLYTNELWGYWEEQKKQQADLESYKRTMEQQRLENERALQQYQADQERQRQEVEAAMAQEQAANEAAMAEYQAQQAQQQAEYEAAVAQQQQQQAEYEAAMAALQQ